MKRDNGNFPNFLIIKNSDGSQTFTLGSRTSDYYLRIYNKHLESGDDVYANCWRFEIEIKGKAAKLVARDLFASRNREADLLAFVSNYMNKRGLYVPYLFPNGTIEELPLTSHSTLDSKRNWLNTQVKPVVTMFVDLGLVEEVFVLLGLSEMQYAQMAINFLAGISKPTS
jgi:DNA relaxase NicK